MGYAGRECLVIERCQEIAGLNVGKKVGLVVQTTAPRGEFISSISLLAERTEELRVFNTICSETGRRQVEAGDLARRVDLMVVVGGRNSSNTRRLVEICEEAGARTCLVETPGELEPRWFHGIGRVGITSGASTPEELAGQVKLAIEEMQS
jgi:4-hydroxy-3-methylbut-2-enyl diphosphate reductase